MHVVMFQRITCYHGISSCDYEQCADQENPFQDLCFVLRSKASWMLLLKFPLLESVIFL